VIVFCVNEEYQVKFLNDNKAFEFLWKFGFRANLNEIVPSRGIGRLFAKFGCGTVQIFGRRKQREGTADETTLRTMASRLPAWLKPAARCNCSARVRVADHIPRSQNPWTTSRRSLATVSQIERIAAAPEIQFTDDGFQRRHIRVIPDSPSYFTGSPHFIDNLLSLQSLLRKHETLPVVQPGQAPRVAWRTLVEYRNMVGESVRASKYQKIVEVLQRLNQIHPDLVPMDVKNALEHYKRDINPSLNKAKPIVIDNFGRALGVGRRKASVARAWVVEGTGEVLVNGKTLAEAFGRLHDRESAVWALKVTERLDKYNVWTLVEGGGTTGQAEAVTLAVAKALLAHEPLLKPALRRGTLQLFLDTSSLMLT
jgi:small subunit ribosomal protein S9